MMFAWGFHLNLLGDGFFERVAWGGDFQGLLCLGTPILAPLLLGDLLGVDLLGAVIQGCSHWSLKQGWMEHRKIHHLKQF